MEEIPSDTEVDMKNISTKGIIIRETEEVNDKGEDIKTTQYFLDVGDQADGDEVGETEFVTVQDEQDTQYVAVEVSDSGQLIIPNKEVILWNEICRVCANGGSDKEFIPIFSGEGVEHELSNKIHNYLPVRVSETDTLPLQVCYNCAATMIAWDEIFKGCVDAQQRLLELQSKLNLKEQYYNDSPVEEENMGTVLEVETANQEEPQEEAKDVETFETLQIVEPNRCRSSQTSIIDASDKSVMHKTVKKTLVNKKISLKLLSTESEYLTLVQEAENLEKEMSDEPVKKADSLLGEKKHITHKEFIVKESNKSHDLEKNVVLPKKDMTANPEVVEDDHEVELSECVGSHDDHVDHSSGSSGDEESEKACSEMDETHESKKRKPALFTCNDCGRIFKFKGTYSRHRRIHSDERPFTCHVCGKRFRDSGGLYRHLRDVHAKVKNWPCSICSQSLASKSTRDDHERIHTGERPYICDNCGKSFKTKASLYIHAKIHTNLFPYPCVQCKKSFRRKQELLAHVTMHTGEKNFECDVCCKSFRIKVELRRHALSHSDVKPFACELCSFRCKQRRYLNNHVKQKHSLIEKRQPNKAANT